MPIVNRQLKNGVHQLGLGGLRVKPIAAAQQAFPKTIQPLGQVQSLGRTPVRPPDLVAAASAANEAAIIRSRRGLHRQPGDFDDAITLPSREQQTLRLLD